MRTALSLHNTHVDKSGIQSAGKQSTRWQTIAAMKRIVLIGVIALVALGIYAVFIRPHPRRAPPGIYFTLIHLGVRTGSGLTGVEPGTRVVCVKDEGPVLLVRAESLEFEAQRQYLTNDLDVADLAVRNDAEAQQSVASYIAQQQQVIEQREAGRRMQASGRR
jgi:hypothetical protein